MTGMIGNTLTVNNVPDWALHRTYMVIRPIDNELWFYDAWDKDDGEKAVRQAIEERCMVIPVSVVE